MSCLLNNAIKIVIIKLYSHDVKLKDEQFCAVESVLRGKDVLAVLPTGFGKSLMYQILPDVFDYMMNVKPLL
jgi:ATP-dependent DNA helicase RecQ